MSNPRPIDVPSLRNLLQSFLASHYRHPLARAFMEPRA